MYDIAITGASVVTAERVFRADLGVKDGRIVEIGTIMHDAARHLIKADGLHVLPGLVDAHVHLREPGALHKETFKSGTMAAAAGGVTTVAAIPNTNPMLDRVAPFKAAVEVAASSAVVDFSIFAGLRFEDPAEIQELADAGAVGFDICDDPFMVSGKRWVEIFEQLESTGLPLGFYAVDFALQAEIRKRINDNGGNQVEQFLSFTSGDIELAGASRAICYATHFDVPLILRTVTTPALLDCIHCLRKEGQLDSVRVEMTPHHLLLDSGDLESKMTSAQMLPPLRDAEELPRLWGRLQDGTVDYLGSDHAPHTAEEKSGTDLFASPPGIVGLETMLPLMTTAVNDGRLSITDVVRLCCSRPAEILNIYPRKGSIEIGSDADLVLVDLNESWVFDASKSYSKGNPSPFDGANFVGRAQATLVRGQVAMTNGEIDDSVRGVFITPKMNDKTSNRSGA